MEDPEKNLAPLTAEQGTATVIQSAKSQDHQVASIKSGVKENLGSKLTIRQVDAQ